MVGSTPGMLSTEEHCVGRESRDQSKDDCARKLPKGHTPLLAVGGTPAFEQAFVRDSCRTANPSVLLSVYKVG
jgi:hypothetical protein